MKSILAFTPNLLTLCNLLSGSAAIVALLTRHDFHTAFWLVIAAALFDFFDGFAARLLRVSSPIGKELDSLADMVSFGLAPATVVFVLLSSTATVTYGLPWLGYFGFLIAAMSALRLAKFNLDERQTEEFRGLPTPACALFFVSLPMLLAGNPSATHLLTHPIVLGLLTLIFSILLVCDLPMFSLKFKNFAIKKNSLRYVFLALSVILIIGWRTAAPALIIMLYIVISAGRALLRPKALKD